MMQHFIANHYDNDEIAYLKKKTLEKDYLFFSILFKGIELNKTIKAIKTFIDQNDIQQYAMVDKNADFVNTFDAFICQRQETLLNENDFTD